MSLQRSVKRWIDIVGSAAALLILSPVLAVLMVLVRWRLGAPVFFTQTRQGYKGRPFTILKFRTMTDAHGSDGRLLPDVQRLTPFGRFLRASSLDELPELVNVLKGEMSLVGPRPLIMAYVERYTDEVLDRADLAPIVRFIGRSTPALLCVERDAAACHRSLIAARLAREFDFRIVNLRP